MGNIHIKTAWDHIRRSPFQAMAAFFVLAITFFVITILSVLLYSSEQVLVYFETRPQIIAFLKDDVNEDKTEILRDRYSTDGRVDRIEYVSKEQALEIYKNATSDNPLLSELVSPSIFPASIEISLRDLADAQEIIKELEQEEVVDQVKYTASLGKDDSLQDVVARIKRVTFYMRLGAGAFAGFLGITSFLVLIVIIGMRIRTRGKEIKILKLIGATSGFVRNPVVLEALFYVFGGVFFGWLFAFILVLYSTPSLISYFGEIPVLPKDALNLFIIFAVILGAELITGIILAMAGSFLAVSRVKK